MKVLVIISSVLILRTSASFFDELGGVVSSVESSFGKLLTDVIHDVKETVDCTLLAVEHVLSLGMFSDSADYDRRCKDSPASTERPPVFVKEPSLPTLQDLLTQTPFPVLINKENRQSDSSILNVDQTLCDALKKDDAHSQLQTVKLALRNETGRLSEISDLLRKQLEDLSNEVKEKFKAIELQTTEPSVETIWSDIKILQEIEHRHENSAEATKISHILDQILDILNANEEDRTTADDYKIKEILSKLSKNAKDGPSDLRKVGDAYPKDFREYANKIFEESRGSSAHESSSEVQHKNSTTEDVKKVTPKEHDKKLEPKKVNTIKPNDTNLVLTTTTTTEKPLTIEELGTQYVSLFDVMPENDSKLSAESARKIIEENKVNEMVMKSLEYFDSNKEDQNVFDISELLN